MAELKRWNVLLFAFFCAILTDTSVAAQQSIRETVVVTANGYPVSFNDLSRAVQVLTREQIAHLPLQSVADLLRYASSLEVRSRGPFGVQSDFSLRGAAFGQVLVLVDGVRINDAQSGHHNGDIPVVLAEIERVEILYGPGSSLHGADAFGGTINIITRKKGKGITGGISAGDFGLFETSAGLSLEGNRIRQTVTGSGSRSSGFMFDRDFATLTISAQTAFGDRSSFYFGHVWKDFGANGFYGPAPSRERTNGTLLSLNQEIIRKSDWTLSGQLFYRTHGDRFLYDMRRPGFFENRHRTHAFGGAGRTQWTFSDKAHLSMGGELAGDWIGSNNLGNHAYSRASLFTELQWKSSDAFALFPGIRYDRYSNFGSSASPSLSASWRVASAVRLRSSLGRAFRIPTFTELYYRDPNHQADSSLDPERAWGAEAGMDWFAGPGWLASLALFSRWERSVIDWVRPTPRERWRTTNLRRLETYGIEAGVQRFFDSAGHFEIHYTYTASETDPIELLSKYVLDFARHSLSAFGSVPLPAALRLGQRIDYKRRGDGRSYWILDSRLSRRFEKFTLYVECFNLLDTRYQEIQGVDMPGRWLTGGVELGW